MSLCVVLLGGIVRSVSDAPHAKGFLHPATMAFRGQIISCTHVWQRMYSYIYIYSIYLFVYVYLFIYICNNTHIYIELFRCPLLAWELRFPGGHLCPLCSRTSHAPDIWRGHSSAVVDVVQVATAGFGGFTIQAALGKSCRALQLLAATSRLCCIEKGLGFRAWTLNL